MWDEKYGSRVASCDLGYGSFTSRPTAGKKATGLENVPPEKMEEWRAYARMLKKKHPHMKDDRIQRKVAEHFKIKLT